MNDMINIGTGNLGPLYQCCATNPPPDAKALDTRVIFANAQQRKLTPVTAITPIVIPHVIQLLDAKRADMIKNQQNMRGLANKGGVAPTSSINPNFRDPRLKEVAAGVGAAGTITAANDEVATMQLMERTKSYAATIVDGCATAQDYNRLLSTRIRKAPNANEEFGGPVGGGSLTFAQLQARFGADVNLATIDEPRLDMFSSMGMLSPQEKQTIINYRNNQLLEAGGGVGVGVDLSTLTGLNNPSNPVSLRTMLKPFEAYLLATLMPATLEEALAYCPTLASYEPLTIEAVLKGLRNGSV